MLALGSLAKMEFTLSLAFPRKMTCHQASAGGDTVHQVQEKVGQGAVCLDLWVVLLLFQKLSSYSGHSDWPSV